MRLVGTPPIESLKCRSLNNSLGARFGSIGRLPSQFEMPRFDRRNLQEHEGSISLAFL